MSSQTSYSVPTGDLCESDCPYSRDFFLKTCSIPGMNQHLVSDCQTSTQTSFGSQIRRLLPHLSPEVVHLVPQGPQPRNSRFRTQSGSTGSIVIPKTVSSIVTPSSVDTSYPPSTPKVVVQSPTLPQRPTRPETPQSFRDYLQTYIWQTPSPSPTKPGEAPKTIWYSPEQCLMYKRGRSNLYSKGRDLGTPEPFGGATYLPRRPLRPLIPSPPPKTIVDDIRSPVDTPWDPLLAGIPPAFTTQGPDLLVDGSFSSTTFTREGCPSPSPPPSSPSSEESFYPDSHDITSSFSSEDEAFLADDETTSLIVPFPCSPPPPNNTPESTPPPEQQPELSIFQRGWRWIKSWFIS